MEELKDVLEKGKDLILEEISSRSRDYHLGEENNQIKSSQIENKLRENSNLLEEVFPSRIANVKIKEKRPGRPGQGKTPPPPGPNGH